MRNNSSTTTMTSVNRDFTFSRTIVNCALANCIENGISIKNPVQCLDLSTNKSEGSKWMNDYGSAVSVIHPKNILKDTEKNNCSLPNLSNESNYTLIERADFNFIYVECTTEGSTYFDCVFRKIARNGLFAISTVDDPALYGRPPEPALRCYAGVIVRTFYAPEMAVRLILAAMAKSAARFSKSIQVLLAVAIKSSITIILKVTKGADSAIKCLKQVQTLVHCSVCEERAFISNNDGYVISDVQKCLSCDCANHSVGRTAMYLGPLWSGPLGLLSFVSHLLPRLSHSVQLTSFFKELLAELRCDGLSRNDNHIVKSASEDTNSAEVSNSDKNTSTQLESNYLKRKSNFEQSELKSKIQRCKNIENETAPAFYYNLHKHKPKGSKNLLKIEKIIDILHHMGFRASRTHFDRAAIKTNCTLSELNSMLSRFT